MKTKRKKGFTLIELIVVMAIIAILVLIASPKFMGYTEKAKLTKVFNNLKAAETAAELYYMDNDGWPKQPTEYTAAQLNTWVEEFKSISGDTAVLEPLGKYYDVDWNLMKGYMEKPDNDFKYIIQNPVGDVYYANELTPEGEQTKLAGEIEATEPTTEESDTSIVYNNQIQKTTSAKIIEPTSGGILLAYDGNLATSTIITNRTETITWEGDMTNRTIRIKVNSISSPGSLKLLDANNVPLNFIVNSNSITNNLRIAPVLDTYYNITIPANAAKITINSASWEESYYVYLYEIIDVTDTTLPNSISDVTVTQNENSIKFNWTNPTDTDFSKVIIFSGDKYVGSSTNGEFTHTTLFENQNYSYKFYSQDTSNNISNPVDATSKTLKVGVVFSGSNELFFDRNISTHKIITNRTETITWDEDMTNRIIRIKVNSISTAGSLKLLDANNAPLSFTVNGSTTTSDLKIAPVWDTYYNITVPANASKLTITSASWEESYYVYLYEIQELE